MKKFIATLSAFMLAGALLVLAGCSASSSSSSASAGSESLEASDVSVSAEAAPSQESSTAAEPASEPSEDSSASAQAPASSAMLSGFVPLSQYPELQNGCEITTLAAVLNYEGVAADKGDLSDNYLAKKPVGQANFYREFVGDPRDADAYGCYAPVIVNAANSYLAQNGYGMSAQNLTGTALPELFSYIDQGVPVIVWGTQYNQPGYYTVTWVVDGESLTWFRPEHCMALVGYDLDQSLVYVSDPMEGAIVSYDIASFTSNYNDLGQQAIVVQ